MRLLTKIISFPIIVATWLGTILAFGGLTVMIWILGGIDPAEEIDD